MYTFHKTSMEKLQSEALLQGLSWNFISTSRIKMEKIHTQKKKRKEKSRHYFLLSALETALAVQVLCRYEKGRAERPRILSVQLSHLFLSGSAKHLAHLLQGCRQHPCCLCAGRKM